MEELQNHNPLTTLVEEEEEDEEEEDVLLSSPYPTVPSQSHHFSSSSTDDDDGKKRKYGHHGKNKFQETRHSRNKHVGKRRVFELRRPHKSSRIGLGTFTTPEMVVRAHDAAFPIVLRGLEEQPEFLPCANSYSMTSPVSHAANHNHHFSPSSSSSSSSRCEEEMKLLERCRSEEEQVVFMDEEALFNFPGLLQSMAEGLMVSPSAMQSGFFYSDNISVVADDFVELCLWTHH